MRARRGRQSLWLAILSLVGCVAGFGASALTGPAEIEGQLADGAPWKAKQPRNWNGTLLLFSHGYSPTAQPPALAPRGLEEPLLAQGYALAASAYATTGWAVAEAVPDQIATLDEVSTRFGKPKRVIAWGESMGGLITVALAEKYPRQINGGLASCGSVAGSLAMMNQALDGAFAFKVLLAPDSGVQLVHIDDDAKNAADVDAALAQAVKTPAGRARLALASALAQLPPWTGAADRPPAIDDTEGQLEEAAKSFSRGVFLPRADQERRAGGIFSWNTGIDYREALARSGRAPWVVAMYARSGLDLSADLDRLNHAPRIRADTGAVAYMSAHYVPTGKLRVPVLSMHTVGDGLTIPGQQLAFKKLAQRQGAGAEVGLVWVQRAGHCSFAPAEHLVALSALASRVNSGVWRIDPAALTQQDGAGAFVEYSPADLFRACGTGEPRCRPKAN